MSKFLVIFSAVSALIVFLFVGCAENNPTAVTKTKEDSALRIDSCDASFFVAQAVLHGWSIELSDTATIPGVEIRRFGRFSGSDSLFSDSVRYSYKGQLVAFRIASEPSSVDDVRPYSGVRCRVGLLPGTFSDPDEKLPVVVIADYPDFHGGPVPCWSRAVVYLGNKEIMRARSGEFTELYYVNDFRQASVRPKIVGWESDICFGLAYDEIIHVSYYDILADSSVYAGSIKYSTSDLKKVRVD